MNSFAVSNGDILEGLQRSSAAMSAMGQDLDSTIALFTGAQEILQDSQTTGTALRNMSLRMRGFDEETEQVSADLVNITGKIIDLTKTEEHAQGVSIFTDETQTHYKDFVDYFRELSEVWDEMSEQNQVELLNQLFGKRGAQAGSALIKNFDTVEAALEKMKNSAGNADAEMGIITNSISYHLNALKETGTGIFQNLFERNDINVAIDGITSFLNVIEALTDKLGLFGTAELGGGLAFGITNIIGAFKALKEKGVKNATFAQAFEKAFPTITSSLVGLQTAFQTFFATLGSGQGVLAAFSSAFGALGASAFPITATILAVGGAIKFLYDKANEGKEANEKMQQSLDAYKTSAKEIEDLNTQLEETKGKISDLQAQGKLTIYEKNELANLQQVSAELEKQIELKKLVNEKEAKEAAENAKKAIERNYGKDAFSTDAYSTVQEQFENGWYDPVSAVLNKDSSPISAISGMKELQNVIDQYSGIQHMELLTEAERSNYEFAQEVFNEGKDRLVTDAETIQSYLDVFNTLPESAKKNYETLISDLERTQDEIWQLINPEKFEEFKVSDIMTSDDNSKVMESLHEAAKQGKLDVELLQKRHDNFYRSLREQNVNVEDFVNTINGQYREVSDGADEAANKAEQLAQQFSGTLEDTSTLFGDDSTYNKMLESYTKQLDTLQAAKDKFNAGTLTTKDMIELQQTFGELNNYDMSNLDEGLELVMDNLIGVTDEAGNTTGVLGLFDLMIQLVGGDSTEMGQALVTMRDNFVSMYDVTENATSSFEGLKEGLALFATQQSAVNTALKESVSATGLTQTSIESITKAYEELEGFDPGKLFETTANGVHLNKEYLKELNDELANTNLSEVQQELFNLQQQINDGKKQGKDTTGLEAQLRDTQLLASQYQGLLSAYNAWQAAQSSGNERDSYESVGSGYKGMQEILDQGWYGDESLNAYLDLILGAENRTDDVIADFEKLKQTIDGTSHSFMDYFQFDDSGKLTTDGLFNFIEDVHEKLGDTFASYDEETGWTFDFTGEKLQEVADAFGISTEMVQLFVRAMSEAGFAVEMDDLPLVDQIEKAKEKVAELQESGEISSDIELDVDVETAPVEEVKSTIDELKEERINIDAEEDPEAAAALDDLIAKLEQQYYIRLNLETNGGMDKAATYVTEINSLISEVDGKPINIDAYIDGSDEIQALVNEIAALPPEVQTSIGIKAENVGDAEGILKQLKESPDSLTVPVNYTVGESPAAVEDAQGVANYILGEYPTSVPDVSGKANFSLGSYPKSLPTIYQKIVAQKEGFANGTLSRAHASGTAYNTVNYRNAYADGDVALTEDEIALINEIGQESIIRDGKWMLVPGGMHQQYLKKGDIILSAAQTKALINTGAAPGHGRSYASGTLMNSYLGGTGGRRRVSSTTTKKKSSSSSNSKTRSSKSRSSKRRSTSTSTKKKSSKDKDDETEYDWIEVKIDRIESKIKDLKEVADNAFASFSDRNKSLQGEIDATIQEIDLQKKAAKTYREEANKIKIDDKWKKLVKNGSFDISSVKDKDLAKKISKFKDLYENSAKCDSEVIKLTNSLGDLTKVKFENIIEKWSAELENFEHSASNLESSIKQRNLSADDFTPLGAGIDAAMGNIPDYQGLIKNAKEQQNIILKERQELEETLAKSLADPKSGITVGSEGYDKIISDINKLDEKYNGFSEDIIGWRTDIKEAYATSFDTINEGYESEQKLSQHEIDSLSNEIDLIEEKGLVLNSGYYKNLSSMENSYINSLQAQSQSLQVALQTAMANGLQEGSKKWYEMKEQINDVDEEIQKHTKSMIEYNKLVHQTKWDNVINEYDKSLHKLERTLDKIQNKMEKRDAKASEYVKFSKSTKAYEKDIQSYQQMIDIAQEQLATKEKELKKLRKQLAAALADPNSGITEDSDTYKDMVSDIENLEDEINTLGKNIIDWGNEIAEHYVKLFDQVAKKFENKMEAIQHRTNMVSNALDIAEAKGYMASTKYYDELVKMEKKNIKLAQKEVNELQEAMNEGIRSGSIEIGSQAWYDMTKQIHEATEAVQEHTLSMIEYQNKAREIKWELFDTVQEKISDITDEAKFMISLMSNATMVDDDGNLTNEAQATMGLHAMNYNVYMNQADRYAQEMRKINKDIAKDPANTILIKRREELLKLQRESILAAEEEKQSIKSIVEDGINEQISAMKDLIEQYKNALDNQKDLYDYQKKISDQTKKIANLEKQLSAYSGDTSEENRARMQKLSQELEEAKEDLEETEYDRYISDQKKLLDNLYDEYESLMNKRLDNIDKLIGDVINSVNISVVDINDTLKAQAKSVGYTMTTALSSVWSNAAKEFEATKTQRVENTKKLVDKLISNGTITQEEGDSIVTALGTGDAQGITNATNIINKLEAEGKLTKGQSEEIRNAVTGFNESSFGKAVAEYDSNFLSKQTTTNQSVNDVEKEVNDLARAADDYATAVIRKIDADEAARRETEKQAKSESKSNSADADMARVESNNKAVLNDINQKRVDAVNQSYIDMAKVDETNKQTSNKGKEAQVDKNNEYQSLMDKKNTTVGLSVKNNNKAIAEVAQETTKKKKKSTATATTTKWGNWFVSKKSNATKSKLNIDTSIVDRLRYFDFDSSKEKRKIYYGAMGGSGGSSKYTGTAKQNSWMIAQMKAHGYKSGAKRVGYSGLAWINEGGNPETIVRANDHAVLTSVGKDDRIYNAMASENLWNAANNPSDFITKNLASINDSIPVASGLFNGNSVMVDGIEINLEGIKDWNSFMYAAQHDKSFEKLVQAMTVDRMVGRNKNSKYNI